MAHIWLDAGHGGKDAGAVGNGMKEKNVALTLATLTGKYLLSHYICKVSYSRTTDIFVELSARATMANQTVADFFISFHVNSSSNLASRGFESYRYIGTQGKTVQFQKAVHQSVITFMNSYNIKDRQIKEADFAVLRETDMPAILAENLFISHTEEAKLLKDPTFLSGLATAYAKGIAQGANLVPKKQEDTKNLASPRFRAAQQWVIQQGISDGTDPRRPATREEVWEMIYRANQLKKR
ncbi:N-acetylmuramoyl-L-alanine amidase [Bacillus sp. REN10]|uniref:N-acetylmuramoyl-L-alanine amidase n=1 Tax=Bacillus sp. REN10 TaxID=2782541 RepID=UPI00193BFBD3|nr:N-acetylmuramoyl-L-alanine amidase [Bacillus sp. REN10]